MTLRGRLTDQVLVQDDLPMPGMTMYPYPRLIALVLVAASVPAQKTQVDPPLFEHLPAARQTGWPFGYPTRQQLRYQEIHDGLAGKSRMISGIALRRSAGSSSRLPKFGATFSMRLSTAPHQAAKISQSFLQNEGKDVVTVLKSQQVLFPETTPSGPIPAFDYLLPTDQPYAFGGKGPLCMELQLASHGNRTPFTFDLYQEGQAHVGSFGKACGDTDMQPVLDRFESRVEHRATGLPTEAATLFLAGAIAKPVDLSFMGAFACELWVPPLVVLGGKSDSKGKFTQSFDLSGAGSGDYYACQLAAIKRGANELGAVLTQGNLVLPVSTRSVGRCWAESRAALTGTAQPVYGLVWEVH